MSKRTIALIALLIVATAFLLALALTPQKPVVNNSAPSTTKKIPPLAQSVLTMSPNPLILSTGTEQQASLNIDIDTGTNKVTAVQLELSYDPLIIKGMEINTASAPGFFENPIVLLRDIDTKNGRVTFALGISPTGVAKSGTGSVATITFRGQSATPLQSQINFLPKSLVTAEGIASSVLKQSQSGIVAFESLPVSIPSSSQSAQ